MILKREDPGGHSGAVADRAEAKTNAPALLHETPARQLSPQRSRSALKHMGAPQSLYSGRERLGVVQQIASGWRAFNRRGQSLGTFPTRSEAIDAIGKSLRGTP